MNWPTIAVWIIIGVVAVGMVWLERKRLQKCGRCPTCGKRWD